MACVLGDRLGPIRCQFPPNTKENFDFLRDVLAIILVATTVTFEFWNGPWMHVEIVDLLREQNRSVCFSDDDDAEEAVLLSRSNHGHLCLRPISCSDVDLEKWYV